MTTIPAVERIILIRLAHAVIWHGVKDREAQDHATALRRLQAAEDAELLALPREKRESALRHARRGAETILAPYIERNVPCAAFGLALVYVIQELINAGLYEPNAEFAEVLEDGLMHEEGTIVERHKSDAASASAVKMGRKVLAAMQSLGYCQGQEAA